MRSVKIDGKNFFELDSLMCELGDNIDKATCILQDIAEGYFQKSKIESQEDLAVLAGGYDEASVKAEIVWDYLFNVKTAYKKIKDLFNSSNLSSLDRIAETNG